MLIRAVCRNANQLSRTRQIPPLTTTKYATTFPFSTANNPMFKTKKESPVLRLPDSFVPKGYKFLPERIFGRADAIPANRLKLSGNLLFTVCAEKPNLESFLDLLQLEDSFFSWFKVTELHIWMLSVRLMSEEGPDTRLVRNSVVDSFWRDCSRRSKFFKSLSGKEKRKQLEELGEEFQAALFIYDEGILGNDMQLANAVWRRFFTCQTPPNGESIEKVVSYIRRTLSALDKVDLSTLVIKGYFEWLPFEDTIRR